ncbi:MAG TPA: glycosyltransferase family 39 protein, partial [Acidimicrobiales bacterium]
MSTTVEHEAWPGDAPGPGSASGTGADAMPAPPRSPGGSAMGPAHPGRARRMARSVVRGRRQDPAWIRPCLLLLLGATAVLYLVDLGASGWANSFYSAAVQAGTKSWKSFFFGSFDASNFITVDKPPASLWVMEISARLFGVNPWSILVPQALEGVASVGLLYLTVRRWFSARAALLAGALLALTPVATLMFRFNNPDALLVLLLIGASYATIRAIESGRTPWLALAGVLVGFGFITKMLQALVIVPVLGLVYLVAAAPPLRRRLGQLALAGAAVLVSGGWWVAAVELTPGADRPYIGGSTDNNLLNLIFGYNGFGRLTGNETGSVGGGGGTGGQWGATGLLRLFNADMGGQISWLIPGALILLLVALWLTRRAPRTDRTRAALVLFGGWLVVTGLLFSFAAGIIHPYYTVALAPAVGGTVAIGASVLWRRRSEWLPRVGLSAALAATSVWAFVLLGRSPTWFPPLRFAVVVVGLACAAALVVVGHWRTRAVAGLGLASLVVAGAAPAAYSLQTASTPHNGSIPSAGPT